MQPDTATYTALYDAKIGIAPNPGTPYFDNDPVFWYENFSFKVESPHKMAQDKPIFEISIPFTSLAPDAFQRKDDAPLKRLKTYFRMMENDTTTYSFTIPTLGRQNEKSNIYDGITVVEYPLSPTGEVREPTTDNDSVYYNNRHTYTLERSHKDTKDKPIVEIGIPLDEIDPDLTVGTDDWQIEEMRALTDAAADFCLRAFAPYLDNLNAALYNRSRPDKENGAYYIYRPKGEVLTRNSAYFALRPQRDYDYLSGCSVLIKNDGIERPPLMCLCFRIQVQLPAKKLKRAMTMVTADLPEAVETFVAELDRAKLMEAVFFAAKQTAIRHEMKQRGIVSFIANGSILPRSKDGISPLDGAVPFRSTPEDEIELCGVRGMGIRQGVTVITGGGYSGKSTLLDAIASGITNHCIGDGRELVLTDESAVSIAAEDGRAVSHLNISPFIRYLPSGSPADFSTAHASGSTSQAANIMEAIQSGAHLLLIDEDRSATNFMIRDSMMKALIRKEPITPFTDRVRELASKGISTILVIGGSGEYLGVSDRVYLMDDYLISDATKTSHEIFSASPASNTVSVQTADLTQTRRFHADRFTSYPEGSHTERLAVSDMGFILIGSERIDIRGLLNIVSDGQLNGIAFILRTMMVSHKPGVALDFDRELDAVYEKIAAEGVHSIHSSFFTEAELFIDLPRKTEVRAAVTRMRNQIVSQC